MAGNMSDDEDIDFRRQRFQHPDDPDDMDINSESDGEDVQVPQLAVFGNPVGTTAVPCAGSLLCCSNCHSVQQY